MTCASECTEEGVGGSVVVRATPPVMVVMSDPPSPDTVTPEPGVPGKRRGGGSSKMRVVVRRDTQTDRQRYKTYIIHNTENKTKKEKKT